MARVICAHSRAASNVVSWGLCLSCKKYSDLLEKPPGEALKLDGSGEETHSASLQLVLDPLS